MNIVRHGLLKRKLDFFMTAAPCPGGGQRYLVLVFDARGTMWIDPGEFGIGPQHAPQLARFPGTYLLFNKSETKVFINARAVVLVLTDRKFCTEWLNYVEAMIKEYQRVRAQDRAEYELRIGPTSPRPSPSHFVGRGRKS